MNTACGRRSATGGHRVEEALAVSVNGALEGTDLASAIVLSVHTPTH